MATKTCPKCNGNGTATCSICGGTQNLLCPVCNGTGKGKLLYKTPISDGRFMEEYEPCNMCSGLRYLTCRYCNHGIARCSMCEGSGTI